MLYGTLLVLAIAILFGRSIAGGVKRLVLGDKAYSPPIGYERLADIHSTLAYDGLEERLKEPYKKLVSAYLSFEDRVKLDINNSDDVLKVFYAVVADYPILFWIAPDVKYEQRRFSDKITMNLKYFYDRNKANYMLAEVEAALKIMSSELSSDWSEPQKAESLYTQLVRSVTYDEDEANQRDVYGALVKNRATCVGYAAAYQLLLLYNGIDASTVSGISDSIGHAWNIVNLDGKYYYSDPTFGEVVGTGMEELIESFDVEAVRYGNMFMDEQTATMSRDINEVQVYSPVECNSLEADYFVRRGLMLNTANANDVVDVIYPEIEKAVQEKASTFQFRFESPELLASFTAENLRQNSPFFITVMNRLANYPELKTLRAIDIGTNVIMLIFEY